MKFALTGDNHLGKSQDLGRTPGERLAEQEDVWRSTLKLARDRRCDAVLHAGDLFDGRRPGPDVMLAAERPLVEHQVEGGCTVYLIAGNHDVPSQDGPCGLDVLAEAGLIELAREPHVWTVGDFDVCALPWTPVSRLVAIDGGETDRAEISALAADLLLETARGMRDPDRRQILLGHWSVSGTSLPNGLPVDSIGGVVLSMRDLAALDYERMVFGHIHEPQTAVAVPSEFLYVGSPQPLDFGEGGRDHGCWLIAPDAMYPDSRLKFEPLPSRQFVTIDVDAEAVLWAQDEDDCHDAVEHLVGIDDLTDVFVKLRYAATEDEARRIDQGKVRQHIIDAGAYRVFIEPTVVRAHRERGTVIDDAGSRVDQLAAYLDAIGTNGDVAPAMLERASTYLEGSTT